MMKKYIRQPKTKFLRVQCACGQVQVVFSKASSTINCSVCGELLAEPTGGKAKIKGEILERIDEF